MTMASGGDGDSSVEIEEAVPIDILNDCTFTSRGNQRITAGIGRRQHLLVALDQRRGAGAGQLGQKMGKVQPDHFFKHGSFLFSTAVLEWRRAAGRETSRNRTNWGGMLPGATC